MKVVTLDIVVAFPNSCSILLPFFSHMPCGLMWGLDLTPALNQDLSHNRNLT